MSGLRLLRKLVELENTSDLSKSSCLEWEHWTSHDDVSGSVTLPSGRLSRRSFARSLALVWILANMTLPIGVPYFAPMLAVHPHGSERVP